LLSQLWPRVCDVERTAVKNTLAADSEFVPMLRRIERVPDTAAASFENAVVGDLPVEFEWVSTAAVHVGVVVHSYLQLMAEEGLNAWSAARVNGCAADFERHLELLGVDAADLRNAVTRVRQALLGVLADPQGRWIVGPHDMAQSELTLVDIVDNRLTQLRVDRTFVEEGVRWIVDYKTGSHEGADAESFLDAEVERYRPQMESYARALARNDERPIRVALYFPLLQALRAWQFSDGG
jgi:ATP-dependent helicase/nuclease subunit A